MKRNLSSSIPTSIFNIKNTRIAPRPIKPKGRGRGQSSLTRSVMEQLKLIHHNDNEKQNDNNGTFIPGSIKPLNEMSKSQTPILPQLAPQLPKVQVQQRAPQVNQVPIQPRPQQFQQNSTSQQLLSANKSSSTPIPIAPKPPIQQQQHLKITAEETQISEVLITREDRSISPMIDPGSNNETVPKEDNTVEMDAGCGE